MVRNDNGVAGVRRDVAEGAAELYNGGNCRWHRLVGEEDERQHCYHRFNHALCWRSASSRIPAFGSEPQKRTRRADACRYPCRHCAGENVGSTMATDVLYLLFSPFSHVLPTVVIAGTRPPMLLTRFERFPRECVLYNAVDKDEKSARGL